MRKINRILAKIIIAVFMMTSVFAQYGSVFAKEKEIQKPGRDKTEIIVKYKSQGKGDSVRLKVKSKLKLGRLDLKKKHGRTNTELLEIGDSDSMGKTLDELKKDPDVEYAQPNYKIYATAEPSDEKFGEQWGLLNEGQKISGQQGKEGVDIKAENAWESTQGKPSVLVGILDTGIDISHKDLKGNIFTNTNEIPGNGIDDDGNGYIDDINGWNFSGDNSTVYSNATEDKHGTHVAGIVAASTNSEGITGVAPKVRILPLKFIGADGGYTSDAIDAIEYAEKMGVRIINCSFGGSEYNQALKDEMSDSSILFICAAGNDGNDVKTTPVYPACFGLPNEVSVAAADNKGNLAAYSNYGTGIDIAAPGTGILSTLPGDNYGYLSGTSMAAPFAAGTAALIQSTVSDLTAAQIAARLKKCATPLDGLKGKVGSGGMLNAYKALINSVDEPDPQKAATTPKTQTTGKGSMVVTLAAPVADKLREEIHFGEEGVNVATGNYSKSCTDMTVAAPGFQVNISRTYNSKDDRTVYTMGKGWTFGFEGSLKQDTTNTSQWVAKLPNGAAQVFVLGSDGKYTANDSHSTLVKQTDGSHILTTKDQYTYGFASTGYLAWMKDRNGNKVTIQADSAGKIQKISDSAGRNYTVAYGTNGYISTVTDPIGRKIQYIYDSNNMLYQVIDPNNNTIATYLYDSGYLTTVKDAYTTTTETITYDPTTHKVMTYKDVNRKTDTYTYDTTAKLTTITDQNNRVIKKWYDDAMYVTKSQDPEGKTSSVIYYADANGFNKYGEEKSFTDRNGNTTTYVRDANGNITETDNPDGSISYCAYDDKNNLIKEVDETGKTTYYVYDQNKINLLKKVQPLNGTDIYTDTSNQSKFAITTYKYYTDSEAAKLGYKAKGLMKSETDPEGNTTTYEYDAYGNKTKITYADGNETTNSCNMIGWLNYTITPEGSKTDYYYDNNGRNTKTVQDGGETTITVYDAMGRTIQQVLPNQYKISQLDTASGLYKYISGKNAGNPAGTNYKYDNTKVKLESVTDAEGSKTSYTYEDIYGNVTTETKPNGSIYLYEYDLMNRQTKVSFQEYSSSVPYILGTSGYDVLSDGRSTKTETKYLNDTDTAVVVDTYDYADKLLEHQNPDGTSTKTTYYANGTVASIQNANGGTTYYSYDGLNRLSETWTSVSQGLYTYSAVTYYRNGWKKQEKVGKDKLELFNTPVADRTIVKTYTYFPDGQIKTAVDTSGAKKTFEYNRDGYMTCENTYTTASTCNTAEYENNHLGKPVAKKMHVRAGDLYGNDINSTRDTILTSKYEYDSNGNLISRTDPDGVKTTYTYDNLDRKTGEATQGTDENGLPCTINTAVTYDWQDKVLTSTDAKGNTTRNQYNARGFLVKVTNAKQGVTLYDYDRAGRKTAEVSPNNYDTGKTLDQMDRTVYSYDNMDRVKTKTEIFHKQNYTPGTGTWSNSLETAVVKAYKYDANGNVIKELSGEGYKFGVGTDEDSKIDSGYGTEYRYDLQNKLIWKRDAASKERNLSFTVQYEYDGAGRKISETRADGSAASYYYNDAGKLVAQTVRKNSASPEQTVKSAEYDFVGNMVSSTDGNGNTTKFEYNALGETRKTIYPGDSTIPGNTITCQYDVMGRLAKQQDSDGTVSLFTYDHQGNELSSTEQDIIGKNTITTTTRYDKNGNKRYETDGSGNVKQYVYDELDRLTDTIVKVTVGGTKTTQTTTCTYDANGNKTSIKDWRGNIAYNRYDTLGRLYEKTDKSYGGTNSKAIQKLEYNADGAQIRSYDALNYKTEFEYDKNGRLITTTDPEGHETAQSYDSCGRTSSKTDGNGNTTKYEYDQFDRLVCVTNAKGEETSYTYDLCGNKLTQTDGNGNTTVYEYNVMNQLAKKIDAGGRTGSEDSYTYVSSKIESYMYNADGDMSAKLDRNGKKTVYTYDIHGRLLKQSTEESSISYTYDNLGNQLTITDSTGITTRTYDELGRTVTKTVPGIGTNKYRYDMNPTDGKYFEVTTDVKGNITTKTYNSNDRLVKVSTETQTTTYDYYDNGSRSKVAYSTTSAAIATEEYTYNKDGQLSTLTNKKGTTVMDTYTYQYDAAHNQTSKTETVNGTAKGTTSYIYDELNRLQKVTDPGGKTTEYTFDAAGNRTTETVAETGNTAVSMYQYNEQNRLLHIMKKNSDGSTETTNYTYDNNGNMTYRTVNMAEKINPVNPPKPKFGMIVQGTGNKQSK